MSDLPARDAQDEEFPANARSIGALKNKSAAQIEKEVVWKRGEVLCASPAGADGKARRAQLFDAGATADDVCQGGLGDCWLLSALACLATRPGAVRRAFVTQQLSPYGRYTLRLWDAPAKEWRLITVSDEFPCSAQSGEPLFTKPHGNELWVLLMEKAFAKFVGSYAALEGGHVVWALEALTGDHVLKLMAEKGTSAWRRFNLTHFGKPGEASSRLSFGLGTTNELHSGPETFDLMRTYAAQRSVIGAGSGSGKDTASDAKHGIVQGHAYAVLRVLEVDNIKLLQLRNPWGSFEWDGPWSDKAPEWDRYPSIRRQLRGDAGAEDDGKFWMEWSDFVVHFRMLDVCHRTTGVTELALDMNEEVGWCGPTLGCITGCADYWCCCAGCRALCCAVESSDSTVEAKARPACRAFANLRLTCSSARAARRVPEHHRRARQIRRGVGMRRLR